MASGFSNTCRLGGVAVGVAGLGAVFQNQIDSKLTELAPRAPDGLADAVSSGGARAAAHTPFVHAASEAFVSALNDILLVGAVTLLVGAVASFALIRARDFAVARRPAPAPAEAQA
jgi:hypothetical protein